MPMRKLKNYKPTRFMAETSHYSKQMADFAVMFIEQLTHTKGTWTGKPFELIDWQERIIRDLFGVLKPNGYRQFNTAYIEIPKKMGKSELAAAVALLLCCGDGEERAEVYGCAADRQQATIVFDVAADMVRMCPALNRRVKILASQKRIIYEPTNSFYQVLSAEAYSKHGFNIHGVVFDELHTQPNRKLFDVMTNAFAGDMPATGATPDFGMMLDDAAKQGMAEPDTAIMAGWLYEGDESIYFDAATAEGSPMPTKLDILISSDEIRVKIIGQGSSYSAKSTESASTVTDWVQIEKDILAVNNYFDRLITLNVHKKHELPHMKSEAVLSIIAGGMNFGVTIKSTKDLDTMEGSTSFTLSMMQPEPLLTLTVSVKPTDEQPTPLTLEGAEVIVVKESGMTGEDNKLLETSLTQALFELFTRVGAALPEEGPILMSLLGNMIAAPEGTAPAEELQLESTNETTEAPQPEVSEAPARVNP